MCKITINIIDFEQELNLVLLRLASELVHRVDKLLQRYRAVVVFVEDLKHALRKKWLKINKFISQKYFLLFISIFLFVLVLLQTFFDVIIFLKSSR